MPRQEANFGKLTWRCNDIDCRHTAVDCKSKVMWSDDGAVQIRGEIFRNETDGQWDYVMRVEVYGTSDRMLPLVEADVSRMARRMASPVGMLFRGRKVSGIDDVD